MERRRAPPLGRLVQLLAALALPVPGPASAQPSEAAVKAAFLSKFANYVAWPAGAAPAAGAPLNICVIGTDPFGRAVDDATRGQQVDQRPIVVRRLASAENAGSCQIAFVQGANPQRTSGLLESLRSKPVLTITDAKAGGQRGMIHFVTQGGRVRFHIDEAAAAQRGLTISSRLLGIALSVRQRG